MSPELAIDRQFCHDCNGQIEALLKTPRGTRQPLKASLVSKQNQLREIHRKIRHGQYSIEDHVLLFRIHSDLCKLAQHVATQVEGGCAHHYECGRHTSQHARKRRRVQ